jgi:hypothetical protein
MNTVALEGSRVAEETQEMLVSFADSDTLIGDKIINEAEDYE